MAAASPDILVRRGIEPGLVGTIVVSALIHAALVAVVVMVPGRFLSAPPKLESYTVDLVAPDVIGGTNLIAGSGKAKEPVSQPAPPPVEAKPAPPQPAAAQPAIQPPVAPPAQAAPLPPAPPPQAAEPPKPVAVQKPPEPPQAAPPVRKPAEPPAVVAAKPPEAKPVAPPKAVPAADAKPPEAKPVAKPAEPPKVAAKVAEPAKPVPPAAAKPAAAKPPQAEVQKKPAEPAKADTAAERAAKTRDDAIATAVQRRAAQVQSGATDARDQQIAAAVQRRSQQVQQGAGAAASGAGGPISIGPGSGTGGTPADLQYILYQGRMEERIKAAWAWAGADKSLRAVIQFNLSPDGDIKNVRTVESSGDRQYDASCERAVRAVNPLEAVPDKYREQFATVEMTFKPSDLEQ